jgi:guanylate kinase
LTNPIEQIEHKHGPYRNITVTPESLEMERLRSKARHNEAQALYHTRAEIAKNLLKHNRPIDEIIF